MGWLATPKIYSSLLGPKYQKVSRIYDRTGLNTKCTFIKTGFKNLRTGTGAKFRPFVDALITAVNGVGQGRAKGLVF